MLQLHNKKIRGRSDAGSHERIMTVVESGMTLHNFVICIVHGTHLSRFLMIHVTPREEDNYTPDTHLLSTRCVFARKENNWLLTNPLNNESSIPNA